MGNGESLAKWVEGEDDHSPSSSMKVYNEWSHTSTSSVFLHGMQGQLNLFYSSPWLGVSCNMQQKYETYATAYGVMEEIPFNMNQSVNVNLLWKLKYIRHKMWLIPFNKHTLKYGE